MGENAQSSEVPGFESQREKTPSVFNSLGFANMHGHMLSIREFEEKFGLEATIQALRGPYSQVVCKCRKAAIFM